MNHHHHLSDLAGYAVEQTYQYGERLEAPIEVARFTAAGDFAAANDAAREWRDFRNEIIWTFAVVRPIYADGCIGQPF